MKIPDTVTAPAAVAPIAIFDHVGDVFDGLSGCSVYTVVG